MVVFVLDKNKKPLMPCSNRRARKLLTDRRARIHKYYPFTIRLVDRKQKDSVLQDLTIKIDPGSKFSGIALVRDVEDIDPDTGEILTIVNVVNLYELQHRGQQIKDRLLARRGLRRRRRSKLRYRPARYLNRTKPKGWLPPSLDHRIDTIMSLVNKLRRLSPVKAIAQELVRFDTQKMQNAEISGVEYQQGELAGYEVKEYLLEKWGRNCVYCDAIDRKLQTEHIIARANGGTNRVSNLTLACGPCNQKKGAQGIHTFLKNDQRRLTMILAKCKAPLKDAAAVNATRWKLFDKINATGLKISIGTGGQTKFNRSKLGIAKSHALDAVCVGYLSEVRNWKVCTTVIKCGGRGKYQRTNLDKYGFRRSYLMKTKCVHGFQTGDTVLAKVPGGRHAGSYIGRIAVRTRGSFDLLLIEKRVTVSYKNCKVLRRNDGYHYAILASL